VVRDLVGPVVGNVHHRDAVVGRRREVDAVHADAVPDQHANPRKPLQHAPGDRAVLDQQAPARRSARGTPARCARSPPGTAPGRGENLPFSASLRGRPQTTTSGASGAAGVEGPLGASEAAQPEGANRLWGPATPSLGRLGHSDSSNPPRCPRRRRIAFVRSPVRRGLGARRRDAVDTGAAVVMIPVRRDSAGRGHDCCPGGRPAMQHLGRLVPSRRRPPRGRSAAGSR
jgi:hypothetical protein